jgi:hypothetical protein
VKPTLVVCQQIIPVLAGKSQFLWKTIVLILQMENIKIFIFSCKLKSKMSELMNVVSTATLQTYTIVCNLNA